MTPQQLAALGEITRKAIADAVKPLDARIAEQAHHIEWLKHQMSEHKDYDDTSLRERIESLAKSIPAPYDDDEALAARLAKQIEAMRADIPAAYDDTAMKSAFSEQGKRVAAVVDGVQAIKDRIEEVAKSVPAAYDDSSLRKSLTEQIEAVAVNLGHDLSATEQRMKAALPADGRDALQLEVLPAIDEQKSYTRGTYAKHAGGLWRAFEQTSGMRGWECIVDGVASLTAEMHGKSLVVRAIQSSGTEAILHATLPVQTYKGVFAQGSDYEIGDTATWGGSVWHCHVTGTKALPGDGSADWTLAVKKGRDGREVVKTERKSEPVRLNGNPLQNLHRFIQSGGAE